ncbi:MAG TPA: hypothetical protein VHG69_14240 [Thermoleophilaceae bacterium]|nr:hypothetical protein [Thermoleophilaceae bacterium]
MLSGLIAAAIGYFIADIYADRAQERELDAKLLSTVSRGVTELYGDAQQLAASDAPPFRQHELNRRLLSGWLKTSAEADALLAAYYPRSDPGNEQLNDHWEAYQGALYEYGKLSCCNADRARSVARVSRYLKKYGRRLRRTRIPQLSERNQELLAGGAVGYYKPLGLFLLQTPGLMAEDIRKADPKLD